MKKYPSLLAPPFLSSILALVALTALSAEAAAPLRAAEGSAKAWQTIWDNDQFTVEIEHNTLLAAKVGEVLAFDLPGQGRFEVVKDGQERLPSGNIAWRGHLRSAGEMFSTDLILTERGVVGDIRTPSGRYHLATSHQPGEVSQNATFFNLVNREICASPDEHDHSAAGGSLLAQGAASKPLTASKASKPQAAPTAISALMEKGLDSSETATVDVMFVYTPLVESRLGLNLSATMDNVLVAANGAVARNRAGIQFRQVGSLKVSPRKMIVGDISAALRAVTSAEDSSLPLNEDFVGVAAKRRELGADIVVFLVAQSDYSVGCAQGDSCMVGVAWQSTQQGFENSDDPGRRGYVTVDVGARDLALTVTHEIGHILGAGHDYVAGGNGLFSDSKGFRWNGGVYGTIMSYAPVTVMAFSSPDLLCGDGPCGVPADQPNPADNARAIKAARFVVANFKATQPAPPPDLSGLWWNPEQSGWALHLNQSGRNLSATWLTYDQAGRAVWYTVPSCAINGSQCSGDVYRGWGTQPGLMAGADIDPDRFNRSKIGSMTLSFADSGSLSMRYTLGTIQQSVSLVRQLGRDSNTTDLHRDGVWWVSQEAKTGVTVTQYGSGLFLSWFTYNDSGRAVWYVVPACVLSESGDACQGALYQAAGPAGPLSGVAYDPLKVTVQPVGVAGIQFSGEYAGRFSWQVGAVSASALVDRVLPTP
ncbi:MAG: hypothetical protein JNM52_08120 [Betaproteobacteria bacterium]|nr:hypothetical protein [Betaproteobacteria bacterium]